eukprot:130954_1
MSQSRRKYTYNPDDHTRHNHTTATTNTAMPMPEPDIMDISEEDGFHSQSSKRTHEEVENTGVSTTDEDNPKKKQKTNGNRKQTAKFIWTSARRQTLIKKCIETDFFKTAPCQHDGIAAKILQQCQEEESAFQKIGFKKIKKKLYETQHLVIELPMDGEQQLTSDEEVAPEVQTLFEHFKDNAISLANKIHVSSTDAPSLLKAKNKAQRDKAKKQGKKLKDEEAELRRLRLEKERIEMNWHQSGVEKNKEAMLLAKSETLKEMGKIKSDIILIILDVWPVKEKIGTWTSEAFEDILDRVTINNPCYGTICSLSSALNTIASSAKTDQEKQIKQWKVVKVFVKRINKKWCKYKEDKENENANIIGDQKDANDGD